MSDQQFSPELLARIANVTALRPRRVLEHILAHGQVTTIELREIYGYEHAPRAARDVRELGFELQTTRVRGPNDRHIAAYPLIDNVNQGTKTGRRAFSRAFKRALVAHYGERCTNCGGQFPTPALQIDHRVPYEVTGDASTQQRNVEDYMLLDPSCNRAKSWSCEHCNNWINIKDAEICRKCMWGSPEHYTHIAMEERRTLTLNWLGNEVSEFELIHMAATDAGLPVEDYAKQMLSPTSKKDSGIDIETPQ